MRPTYALIDLLNLRENYLNLRKKAKDSKVMAVVKADAYGHGMFQVVNALKKLSRKPEYYGVALTEEAVELRKFRIIDEPILSFAPFSPEELKDYYRYNIIPTVCSERHIEQIKSLKLKKKLKVHLNIDTGMGRLGIEYKAAVKAFERLDKMQNLIIDGTYTHFATSDESDKSYAHLQIERFNSVLETCRTKGIEFGLAHAANSGAILDLPSAIFDMVRPGISLYGYYPSLETSESVKLKPVMSLISGVSTIKRIVKGDSVSYGRKFIADRDTNIASVPVGYADGVSRALTNKISGVIRGKLYNQIGRVTMDRIMFDVKNEKIRVGDEVILIGKKGGKEITAWHWCGLLDTIPYEITCNIGKRVPRLYEN